MRHTIHCLLGTLSLPLALALGSSDALCQGSEATATPRIVRFDAGIMRTDLGYGIALNKESTLKREGIAIIDSRLPATLNDSARVITTYERENYHYVGMVSVTAREALTAFEVRFLVFNVFGDRVSVLSTTQIADVPAGATKTFLPKWTIYSENEAEEHYASIGFVARVRTQAGKVIDADLTPVLAEARRFSRKLTEADLAPKPAPQK
jgi:hypothetical protein